MAFWNRRKSVDLSDIGEGQRLKPTLSWPHLVALGVGGIVGTGILTLIGVGAGKAGPAVILSFAIAGAICACAVHISGFKGEKNSIAPSNAASTAAISAWRVRSFRQRCFSNVIDTCSARPGAARPNEGLGAG